MADTTELKPCPCCGGDAEFDRDEHGWHWIQCRKCGMCTNQRASTMEDCRPLLAEAWNMRTADVAHPADAALADEIEWPVYHTQGMGCGIEDRGITDRYEACQYGFQEAVDQCAQAFDNWIQTHYLPRVGPSRNLPVDAAPADTTLADAVDAIAMGFRQYNSDSADVLSRAAAALRDRVLLCLTMHDEMVAALKAVVSVADRKTDEFDMARAAIAKAEGV